MARPRQAKPKRSNGEAQEIEELEQRLAQLDPVVASADGQEGQGGVPEHEIRHLLLCLSEVMPPPFCSSFQCGGDKNVVCYGFDVAVLLPAGDLKNFEDLPLSRYTIEGLKKARYIEMTAIQKAALPHALTGQDVLGAAKTGSGKTLAFTIPVCTYSSTSFLFLPLGCRLASHWFLLLGSACMLPLGLLVLSP